jgi:hypothetical protein
MCANNPSAKRTRAVAYKQWEFVEGHAKRLRIAKREAEAEVEFDKRSPYESIEQVLRRRHMDPIPTASAKAQLDQQLGEVRDMAGELNLASQQYRGAIPEYVSMLLGDAALHLSRMMDLTTMYARNFYREVDGRKASERYQQGLMKALSAFPQKVEDARREGCSEDHARLREQVSFAGDVERQYSRRIQEMTRDLKHVTAERDRLQTCLRRTEADPGCLAKPAKLQAALDAANAENIRLRAQVIALVDPTFLDRLQRDHDELKARVEDTTVVDGLRRELATAKRTHARYAEPCAGGGGDDAGALRRICSEQAETQARLLMANMSLSHQLRSAAMVPSDPTDHGYDKKDMDHVIDSLRRELDAARAQNEAHLQKRLYHAAVWARNSNNITMEKDIKDAQLRLEQLTEEARVERERYRGTDFDRPEIVRSCRGANRILQTLVQIRTDERDMLQRKYDRTLEEAYTIRARDLPLHVKTLEDDLRAARAEAQGSREARLQAEQACIAMVAQQGKMQAQQANMETQVKTLKIAKAQLETCTHTLTRDLDRDMDRSYAGAQDTKGAWSRVRELETEKQELRVQQARSCAEAVAARGRCADLTLELDCMRLDLERARLQLEQQSTQLESVKQLTQVPVGSTPLTMEGTVVVASITPPRDVPTMDAYDAAHAELQLLQKLTTKLRAEIISRDAQALRYRELLEKADVRARLAEQCVPLTKIGDLQRQLTVANAEADKATLRYMNEHEEHIKTFRRFQAMERQVADLISTIHTHKQEEGSIMRLYYENDTLLQQLRKASALQLEESQRHAADHAKTIVQWQDKVRSLMDALNTQEIAYRDAITAPISLQHTIQQLKDMVEESRAHGMALEVQLEARTEELHHVMAKASRVDYLTSSVVRLQQQLLECGSIRPKNDEQDPPTPLVVSVQQVASAGYTATITSVSTAGTETLGKESEEQPPPATAADIEEQPQCYF